MDKTGLGKNAANYIPLTPISFLRRTARIEPNRTAVIYGDVVRTWEETRRRCAQLASALARHGVGRGDVVSCVAANTPELLEAHFGVPMAGGVLNAINIRLDSRTLRYIFEHSEAKVILADSEFSSKVKDAIAGLPSKPLVIDIADAGGGGGERIGRYDYEEFLAQADGELCLMPEDEWEPIALNYTSGTTGNPKGVIYHHRGSYLMSMGSAVAWGMRERGVYLYTVPMFHCNGWGYAWTNTMLRGTFVCIRKIAAADIFKLIAEHRVDYLGGAPVVLNLLINAPAEERRQFNHPIKVMTAGAPPPASTLSAMAEMGFEVTHVYGLTETYGHTMLSAWRDEWNSLSVAEQAEIKAKQGVGYPMLEDWDVVDENLKSVAKDGKTMGEIVMRGNTIMSGYLKNESATRESFKDGWFRTGDLAVAHPDEYVQVKDRLKDVVISGGENISSIEVESAICRHSAVLLAAVVAKPDDKWGETPCAFVELKSGATVTADEIIAFCRKHLAGFKCPRYVVFGELPKTATGKIKKYELRERAKNI